MTRKPLLPSRETGAALAELALVLPVLLMLMFGAADFARFYYFGMQLTVGARQGVQWGARNQNNATDTGTSGGMATAAINSTNMSSLVSANGERYCQCLNDTTGVGGGEVACSTSCASGSHKATYVRVTTTATFRPVSRYIGLPATFSMSRKATQRVPD